MIFMHEMGFNCLSEGNVGPQNNAIIVHHGSPLECHELLEAPALRSTGNQPSLVPYEIPVPGHHSRLK